MVVRLFEVSSKTGKNAFFVFLGCFCAYVGQPHNHIGWATSMSFASINPTNPWTNPRNFHNFYWELGILKNSFFFELAILKIFCQNFFFLFLLNLHENQSKLHGYQGYKKILMLFLVIAMYCQGSSSQKTSITQPLPLLAGWEGSLGTCSR
jgi:hypothetical protein